MSFGNAHVYYDVFWTYNPWDAPGTLMEAPGEHSGSSWELLGAPGRSRKVMGKSWEAPEMLLGAPEKLLGS